jgi:hypothetical protein
MTPPSQVSRWLNFQTQTCQTGTDKTDNSGSVSSVSVTLPHERLKIEALERCQTFWTERVEHYLKQGLPEVEALRVATRETMPMFKAEDQQLIDLKKKE